MGKYIHWPLLTIYLLTCSTLILAEQPAPKYQSGPQGTSYHIPKSGAAEPSSQWGDEDRHQNNRAIAPKQPINPVNPLVDFQSRYPNARIVLHQATGLPHVISGLQSERKSGSAEQIARDFLTQNHVLLLPDDHPPGASLAHARNLELIEVMQSRNAQHVHFRQVYRGVGVYLGVLTVHIQDGRVVMYTGVSQPPSAFRNLLLQPTLGESQATEIGMQELRATAPVWLRGEARTNLYIYPADDGTYHLAYQAQVPAAVPLGDWELLIDAHTGEVLQRGNLLMHVDGQASIYNENPITGPPVERPLDSLDGSGFLKGDFVNLLVYTGSAGVRVDSRDFNRALVNNAFSRQNDFRYEPATDSRFDEANVYFHIDRIHDYFTNSFNFTGRDEPFPVIVGHPAINEQNGRVLDRPMNNAFFSPFSQLIAIGEGTGVGSGGLNNLARDADVLYHEYSHAVVERIVRLGIRPNDFGRAMGEAYADYFPCSFFNDPDMGEWSVSNLRGLRNLDNDNRFPDDIFFRRTAEPEEHFTGLIWSGACWTLRERIGARNADQVVFDSLFFLPRDGSANFQNGLTAMLQADQSIFDGEHQGVIRQVFNDRGICELAGCPLTLNMPIRASITNQERLGVNQYTVEVPDNVTELQVDLRALQTSQDIDLYVRFDRSITVQQTFSGLQIAADHRSEGAQGIESITINAGSSPGLQAGTYYVAIVNWTDQPRQIDYDLTASLTQSQIRDIPLAANVPVQGSIAAGAVPDTVAWLLVRQYTVEIGDGVQQLDVIVTPDNPQQDLDFAVRFNRRIVIEGEQVMADVIDKKPTGGGTITLELPELQPGTYYIAIGNFDRNTASFTIEARITEQSLLADMLILTSGTPVSGSSEPGNPPTTVLWDLPEQCQIDVPSNAASLTVRLESANPAQDLDLAVRHREPVQIADERLITDFLAESPSGTELISVNSETAPPLRGGVYYIAIGSFDSQQADWTLTATVSAIEVSLTPIKATVEFGHQQQFNATVTGTANPTIVWWVNGIRGGSDSMGTVDTTGLYTAPRLAPDVNPVTVRAVSLVDQTQSASALVTVVPPPNRYIDLLSGVAIESEIGPGVRTPRETIWQLNEQYRISVPEDAQELVVTIAGADAAIDLDFAVRFNQRVELEGRQIIADFINQRSESGGSIRITSPELRTGVYHIAVGNFGLSMTTFTVTATVIAEPQMLRVAQNGSGDFTAISEALGAASALATIEILDDGVYTENIVIEREGIILKPAPGRTPTIDGDGFPAIVIDAGRDITISGLRLINGAPALLLSNRASGVIEGNSISGSRGTNGDGICLRTASRAIIRNNKIFENAQTGVCASDSIITLIDNEISGNGTEGVFILSLDESANRQIDRKSFTHYETSSRNTQYALTITRHTSRFASHVSGANLQAQILPDAATGSIEIRDNRIFGNIGAGVVLVGEVRGTIEDNRIENNDAPETPDGLDGGILIVDVTDALALRSNVIATNGTEGVMIFGSTVELVNNQITHNGNTGIGLLNGLFAFDRAAQATVTNTTIAGNGQGVFIETPVGLMRSSVSIVNSIVAENGVDLVGVESAQVRYSLTGDARLVGENNNIGDEPGFADSAAGDYQLISRSPAIDAGTSKLEDLPDFDLLKNPRIFDGDGDAQAEVDLGAYEFQGGQPLAIEITPTTATVVVRQVQGFSVTLTETTDQRVRWQVNGIPDGNDEVGAITPDGVYTAPVTVPGTNPVTVEAISLRDTSIRATASVTVASSAQPPNILMSDSLIEGELSPGRPNQRIVVWDLENQYQIFVPAGAIGLTVQLESVDPSQDIDLALRHRQPVQIRPGQLVTDLLSETLSGSEAIIIDLTTAPPVQSGTYFIAVGNFDAATAKYTLRATIQTGTRPGLDTPIQLGETIVGTIGAGSPPDFHLWDVDTQYTIDLPPEVVEFTLELTATDANQNIDLAVRFEQKSTIEAGILIADAKSQSSPGNERLQLTRHTEPSLKAGTYYITVGNLEAVPVEFTLIATISEQATSFPPWDVNEDGVTDLLDLVTVGQQFGLMTLTNPRADVNGDGKVDILDIVRVSSHFGERSEPAAPNLRGVASDAQSTASARVWLEPTRLPRHPAATVGNGGTGPGFLRARLKTDVIGGEIYGGQFRLSASVASAEITEVQRGAELKSDQRVYWHTSTNGITFTHLGTLRGIAAPVELAVITLQVTDVVDAALSLDRIQLVAANGRQIPVSVEVGGLSGEAMLIPDNATLLPNYPNPFNPETWIPYQLAKSSQVLISIYDAGGGLFRQLALGHRAAGSYISRSRAAYWDGRNQHREKVSSGVYFYHIEAKDFSAIRKMVVLK